jgi:hypothetical protein
LSRENLRYFEDFLLFLRNSQNQPAPWLEIRHISSFATRGNPGVKPRVLHQPLASNVDVEQLANFCVAVIQGAMLAGKIRVDSRCVESIMEDLLSHLKRYVRVPRAPRKRVAKHHHAKQPTASPKALVPTTIAELQDWSATKDLMEDHHNDPTRPENEV